MIELKPIKTLIIDDSFQARKLLRLMLNELGPTIQILGEAENVNEGLALINKHNPDLIFLDIEMPGKSGLEFAEELAKNKITCEIIFTTAYNQYAINAFRLSAIDYLLKPINEIHLKEAVHKIKEKKDLHNRISALSENIMPTRDKVISVPVLDGYEYIPLKNIEYIEADGSYVHISLLDKKQKTISKNLKYFEQTLSQFPNFVRVHRSFLINIDEMKAFSKSERGVIIMNSGKLIDLSRDRRAHFIKTINQFNK